MCSVEKSKTILDIVFLHVGLQRIGLIERGATKKIWDKELNRVKGKVLEEVWDERERKLRNIKIKIIKRDK